MFSRSSVRFVPIFSLLFVLGCLPSPKLFAAKSLNCKEELIEFQSNTSFSQVATGCGKSDVMVLENDNKWTSFRERLVFELSCPDDQIDIRIISPSTYGVTGCGHKVLYKYVPSVGVVANTAQTKGQSAGPNTGAAGEQ